MVSRGEKKYVIWPIYFDKSISRLQGRKVAKKYAIEKPSLEGIMKSAKSLGLNPQIEKECIHPSSPWKHDGRVLVDKKGSKAQVLVQIAKRL